MSQTKVVEKIKTMYLYTSAAPRRVHTNSVAHKWDEVGQPSFIVIINFI